MKVVLSRRLHRILPAVLLTIIALSLTACGNNGPTVVNVKLTEYGVTLDKTSVPAGPIKFVIQNSGTIVHELVLEPANSNDKPFESNSGASEVENLEPGKSATLEWTLDEPGTYQLGCHTPGHFEQGMFATFEVTAP